MNEPQVTCDNIAKVLQQIVDFSNESLFIEKPRYMCLFAQYAEYKIDNYGTSEVKVVIKNLNDLAVIMELEDRLFEKFGLDINLVNPDEAFE
jgi:hypothetical protein